MNGNIEVVNENLLAVNMQYVKQGYIKELHLISDSTKGNFDQIYLSNTGVIILDSSAKAYTALKKMFLIYMQKSTDELMDIMKMNKVDELDMLCENVIGWEIKRQCVKAEYIESHSQQTFLDKVKNKVKKFLERR